MGSERRGGAFAPRAHPLGKTPNLYQVLGLQPGQDIGASFRDAHRYVHSDKRRAMTNDGLDEPRLLAKIFRKPTCRPAVSLPPDIYNASWNSASSGNIPWGRGIGTFHKGRTLTRHAGQGVGLGGAA
eukprot:632993-Pyramimonas_sp.AAC.1